MLSDQETVEDEVETVEDTAVETEESETETTVEDAAPQPLADFDDDDDDQEEDLRPVQASIWDASDESEYADLDEYEEDEDDDFDVDDSLLAAAITAAAPGVPVAADVTEQAGHGIDGTVDGARITVGSPRWLDAGELGDRVAGLEEQGMTVVIVHRDEAPVAAIGVPARSTIRISSRTPASPRMARPVSRA